MRNMSVAGHGGVSRLTLKRPRWTAALQMNESARYVPSGSPPPTTRGWKMTSSGPMLRCDKAHQQLKCGIRGETTWHDVRPVVEQACARHLGRTPVARREPFKRPAATPVEPAGVVAAPVDARPAEPADVSSRAAVPPRCAREEGGPEEPGEEESPEDERVAGPARVAVQERLDVRVEDGQAAQARGPERKRDIGAMMGRLRRAAKKRARKGGRYCLFVWSVSASACS